MIEDDDRHAEDGRIGKQVRALVDQCEDHLDRQKDFRERALRAYRGDAEFLPHDEGRSAVVSMDLRKAVQKIMPSIMRTLLSSDTMVEYDPTGPADEEAAKQATDYVNAVVLPECGAEIAVYDATQDALLLKTGILKWSAYERRRVEVREFTGQPVVMDVPTTLAALEEVGEVSDVAVRVEQGPEGPFEVMDYTIRHVKSDVRPMLEAIPRGAFLIHPLATCVDDSPLVGERQRVTRSDLVSRGYDKEVVWDLARDDGSADDDDDKRRGVDDQDVAEEADVAKAMQTVTVYDVYVALDMDGDGIAETYHVVMAEASVSRMGERENVILEMEEVSEVPYADIVAERDAHQFEGHALTEDLEDVQTIKTMLWRQTMDNLVWANNPQPEYDPEAYEDEEAIVTPMFGQPIRRKAGRMDPVTWHVPPFVADKSFAMLEYLDEEARDRTGVTDASGGASPEMLRQMTATASGMLQESGLAHTDMVLRSLARGLRKAFRGLLGLVIAHADAPRTVKLRGEWVQMDPREWDAAMDCRVNIGLGAGSRDRDMSALQMILGNQIGVIDRTGPNNPLVKPSNVYATLAKMVEAAGLPSPDPFYTAPDDEEIARQAAERPDPEAQKLQMQMQAKQAEAQMKAQAQMQIEAAQRDADLRVQAAQIEAATIRQAEKLESDRQIAVLKGQMEAQRERLRLEFQREKLAAETGVQMARELSKPMGAPDA